MDREIEIKIQIDDQSYNKLLKWLEGNAELESEKHQIDTYYNNPLNSFTFKRDGYIDADDYLRIRKTDKDSSICFKHWVEDPNNPGKHLYCDEFETDIQEPDQMDKLLQAIGYRKDIIVDKKRQTYEYKYFEFDLDNVKDLGHFVEIEIKKDIDPKTAHQEIYDLLKQIGLSNMSILNRGYVSMLWNPDQNFSENIQL